MSITATLGTDVPGGNVQAEQKFYRMWGTLAFTGNNAAGGVAVSFAGLKNIPNATPIWVNIKGINGYEYRYVKATKKVKTFQMGTGAGLFVYAESDIKGSAITNVITPGGTLPTNGALLSSLAAADNTTAFTIATSPDIARVVSISLKNTNAGASAGNAASYAVVGTFRGAAQTETISFLVSEVNSTGQNDVFTKYGSKPFDTITSITPSAAQPANWQHAAGIGSKIGLPRNLYTPAESDIVKLTKNAADLAITGTADTTNMTINFGTLADGDDISAEYNSAPTAAGELPAAAFPSGVTGDTVSFEAVFPKY